MNIIEFIPHANFTEYNDEEFYESYDNIIKDNSKEQSINYLDTAGRNWTINR